MRYGLFSKESWACRSDTLQEMLQREKVAIFIVNKGHPVRDFWSNLYDQLTFRHCEHSATKSEAPFEQLRYGVSTTRSLKRKNTDWLQIYETEEDTLATGLDTILQIAGATRLCSTGSLAYQPFGEWIALLNSSLSSHFKLVLEPSSHSILR